MNPRSLFVLLVVLVSAAVSAGTTTALVYYLNDQELAVHESEEKPPQISAPKEQTTAEKIQIENAEASLQALNNSLVQIAEKVKPSVVTVFTEKVFRVQRNPFFNHPFFRDFFRGFPGPQGPQGPQGPNEEGPGYEERRRRGLGSGVIVSGDGYILTNNHVIEGADEIKVRTLDQQTYTAEIVGRDPKTDIAVIRVQANGLTPISQGDSERLKVGEIVLAIGSPMSESLAHTVTQGIVSAKGRSNVGLADYEDFIQTDADINPGNSGGALVSIDGSLIGINTAIASRSGGSQGIGFAVPVNMVRTVMNSLIETGEVTRSWLGVQVQDLNEALREAMGLGDQKGVLIAGVKEGSPADRAGFKAGDVIIKMEGQAVESASELRNVISLKKPGAKQQFSIIRDSKKQVLTATLERLPSELGGQGPSSSTEDQKQTSKLLGFEVVNFSKQLAAQLGLSAEKKGVVVNSIDRNSEAYEQGIRKGDLIESINKKPTPNIEAFRQQLKNLKEGQTVLFRVSREAGTIFIAFTPRS